MAAPLGQADAIDGSANGGSLQGEIDGVRYGERMLRALVTSE